MNEILIIRFRGTPTVVARLVWVILLLPVVEIGTLVGIGYLTNWTVPIGLVLGTGLAGAWILRRYGLISPEQLRAELAAGRPPADLALHKLTMIAAGVLLLVPGVLTDAVAMLLLVPTTRRFLQRHFGGWFSRRVQARFQTFSYTPVHPHDEIIDVQVTETAGSPDAARKLPGNDPTARRHD